MSSSKNTHLVNGWEAFSYFCCSAWNDTYLIDISKAAMAGDLHTQKAQFVPVTQIYTSIDNLMSQKKLYSVFEYPMAPDISSSTHVYSGNSSYGNLSQQDAASVVLNPIIDNLKFQRIDNSNNIIGQGLKCKPKMYDCIRVGLKPEDSEFSLAVTPTRIPYFGLNQGNMVANTKPQRVIYIVSAEREELEGRHDSHDVSGATTQMKIVNDPFLLTDKDTILINCDIDMERGAGNSALKSKEFGDVTVSYSYNWDVHGEINKYPQTSSEYKLPLQQSGTTGSRYLVVSCVPTINTRDKRNNVHKLTAEFYGISPNDDDTKKDAFGKVISFGYVSYHSLGGKSGVNDDLERLNNPSGYSFPQSNLVQNKNASVFDDNWFDNWVIAYSDLANALQGKSAGSSANFSMKMSTNETLAYSKMVNQTAVVNTNFLKKLLYIKKNTYLKTEDSVKIYVTVLEDWVTPANALDSYNSTGTANGAAYIPYLDVNASRQIVVPDYDIWDSGESENPTGKSAPTSNYTVGGKSNHNTMVPHQGLNVITAFPSWNQVDILTDSEYEGNKDMLLFDWRAKTLAQPTFACCALDKIMDLGSSSTCVRIDQYAGSFISNEFKYSGGNNSDFILDANSENIYEAQDASQEGNIMGTTGSRSYVADKNTYVHGMEKIYNQFSLIGNKIVPGKLFTKFDSNKNIFKNDTFQLNKEPITIITSRFTKMPWFTWEGLSLPVGAQSSPASGDIRCILTKKAVTALVSIIRTASLLVSGMVMNHELEFKEQTIIDVITNKTLYIAWYNTKKFFEQLDNIPISQKFIPELTEDYSHGTIRLPSWLDIFKQSSNIKISQFFRSKFCVCDQLERLIGPTLDFNNIGIKGDGDADKNYPPDFSVTSRETSAPKLGVKNIKDETLNYYDISFNSRNKIEYADARGNTYADDMWRYDQSGQSSPGTTNATLLRGLLRPIMWDPLGTYPNHALIPFNRRGQILGEDWEKLIYISSEGTLRNNGNCLQKTALNYISLSSEGKELNQFSKFTAALMYCTPYIPVGKIRIADPQSITYDGLSGYVDTELYRHQDIDPRVLNDSGNDAAKAFLLNYGATTTDISSSTLFTSTSAVLPCGPPINGAPLRQCTLASGTVIPKGIGFNNGYNNKTVSTLDCYAKKIDLARNRRRLNLHTIIKGYNGKGLYNKNNNMGIGPLTWSDLHEKLVETGDGYSHDSLFEKTSANKDFYVTDSLYRTQTMISLLLSGYGLYSDKVYNETGALHPAITGTYDVMQQEVNDDATTNDVKRNKLYEFSSGRKRFLSGPNATRTCNNCDLLNLRLNNGDEITQKENPETAYRWVGPSSHFLMEPNTKDIWRYIEEDKPLNNIRSSVKNRNEFSLRSESFASAGTGLDRHTKTYLHNGIKDGTDGPDGNSNIFSAIGSAYEIGDFYENRPSLFAIARGYDISRNSEIENLTCTDLTSNEINCNYSLGENSEGELIYKKLDKTDLDVKTNNLADSKKVEIKGFTEAMESMVNSLCQITPATDKAPLHLSDHHFTTLAADEELNSSMIPSSYYNHSKYFRLQTDMKDYINTEMTLLDLTGMKDAMSERKIGGAMVEAMYYIDDLSSSTIRIFYPTPLRDEFVRPDKSNGMVTVAAYVADTCKGYGLDAAITGITRYNDVQVSDTHHCRAFFWDASANLEPTNINNEPALILNVQDSTTDKGNININANNHQLMIGFTDALTAEYINGVQDAVGDWLDSNISGSNHAQFALPEERVRAASDIPSEIALIRQELLSRHQFEYEVDNTAMTNAEKYLSKNRETFKIINAINKSDSSWNAVPCDRDGMEIDMTYLMDISIFDEEDEDADNGYIDSTLDISGMIIKYPKRSGYVSKPQVTFNTENAYALKTDFSHQSHTTAGNSDDFGAKLAERTVAQGKLINRNASLIEGGCKKFHPNNTSLPGPYNQLTRTITSANHKAIYNDSINTIEQHGMTFPTVGDSSFNNIILSNQKAPQGLIQNFIYGRGGIITKKRQSILELIDNLPGWRDGKVPLNNTEGGKLLKAFIKNPYKNATSGATSTGSASGSVAEAQHLRRGRSLAINSNLDLTDAQQTHALILSRLGNIPNPSIQALIDLIFDKFDLNQSGELEINELVFMLTESGFTNDDLVPIMNIIGGLQGINSNLEFMTLEEKNRSKREIDVMRYSNMSVLTITGVRDFAFLNKSFSSMTPQEKDELFKGETTITMEQSTDVPYVKKKIFSRIGSMLLPGTNKKTKYVIANHEQDKETLAKSILKNLGMGNIDDSGSANYAIKGTPFEVKEDTDMNSYYLEATKVPGFIASNWNKVQACICAPSMSSKETGNDIEIHPGQIFRANFGVIVKQKTSGVEGSDIGLSAVSQLIPLEYTLKIHTIKSPADIASENSNGTIINTKMYKEYSFHNKVLNDMKINLMLRSVSFDETEIMNYYKLNTIIFLDEGSAGENYKQVDKFVTNMPENLTQYLGYMNRTVTAFFQEYPSNGYADLGRSRYGIDNINKAHTKQIYTPEALDINGNDINVFFHTQYSANQLYFESNLINVKSIQNDFDKQLMAWNEGIVGAKIGDMKLDDFDNISAEQVVDSSETLTEVPGFHILMWTEIRTLDEEKNIISKKIVTQDLLDEQKGWILSSGREGLSRGLYDDINFSLYEQDLLVKKGALTIQNEQIINNRNPVVRALATRGQITPERKYEYGVYKENMWFSMYKNSAATNINIPIINELDTVTHLDSIGLNTSHCERQDIKKNIGILVFQHANVLYENHSGINFSIPSSLKNINQALNNDNKLTVNDELVFCMCAVPENNHQVASKSGVNPSNSSLLNIIINDKNINNTAINQWGLCYDEIKIRSEPTKTSEFENQYIYRDENGNRKTYDVDRDIHFNMIIDLFRSKNTTNVRPLMIFNKLPRMEQVKTALDLNCRVSDVTGTADYPLGEYAPFLSTGFSYSKNIAIISRLKYHTDHLNNLLTDASGMTGSEGHYYGANTNPTWTPHRTTLGVDNDRETLMDLFYIKNDVTASSNMFTVTKLEAERNVKSQEVNGCNAYTGGAYGNHKLTGGNYDLNEVPFYADTSSNQMSIRDGVLKSDISGNILHHYRYLNPKKTGVTGMWVETLIYFTSLLTRPLLDGEDNLSNVFWKVKDVRAGEWTRMPPELKDATNHFEDKMRSYRKCLVSSLLHQHHDSNARFSTEILGRRPPATWLETGKLYNAFPQLEFCATFRNQLVDKSFKDSQGAVKLIKNLAKFPLYCYLDDNNQNIVFPSWKEEGILINGQKQMVYEEKINYAFALDYYGNEFITDILDPTIGFGLNATTPFERVKEFRDRLIESNKMYVKGPAGQQINSGSRAILDKIFDESSGSIIRTWDNTPRTLGSDSGYLKELGLIQMWVPFFDILFELKRRLSIKNPIGDQMSSYIQPDVCIGGHVNTFKNKFDIQNYQLKLNTVRLDINLLKECTAFEIKEIEFSDNTLLTLDTINPVGNPQSLFLPIMIKTKEENIETVSSRKVELKTDYLLETLNKMDVMSLMNNIWYRIDEMGNRIVLSPTEVARVPLFRNYPGIMLDNNYEPIIKHELTKETTQEEMKLEILKHVDGGEVRGVNPFKVQLKEDRTWSGMGWCLKGIGQRLGFTGGHLDIFGREQQNDITKALNPNSIKNIDDTYEDWFIEEFGLLANKPNGYDASGSVLFGGSNVNSKGASASSVFGAHRQQLHPTQNTGGFVRSAWLAEKLATIVFGKQDFPSFDDETAYSGNIPFNDKMGNGTGGLLTPQYNKKYYQKSKPMMTIIADSEFGRLKLADVRQDDSSRGQLRDYRYPGKRFDYDYNVPIFAESIPNTNGAFACQIIRMIKSGLVSRPEDNKILINEQNVIDQVNGGVYMAFSKDSTGYMTSNVHKSIYTHLPNDFTNAAGIVSTDKRGTGSTTNSTFNNIVMNPQQFMYLKLQEKKIVNVNKPYEGGFVPMQYVLQQLLSNDPQRFILNEKESDRYSDFTQKDSNNFNKTYKQWRASVLDSGLPTDANLTYANDRDVGEIKVSSGPKQLQILPTVNNATAHPLALCIRGLDLDHCVMTYKDLSNNTLTATASDPEGEFLKGSESDFPVHTCRKNTNHMNDAYLAGHIRDETENVRLEKIFKYGPALHLTEGNAPMRHDNTSLGRHKDLNWNGSVDADNSTYWGNTTNLMTDDVSGSGIVGWNSYIQHTDLTKTYPIYMLPLMDTDTLSIIVTNEGSLKDPLEASPAAEKNFSEVLADITREIKGWSDAYTLPKDKLNLGNTTGMGGVPGLVQGIDTPDGILPETIEEATQDFPSITGHGINISGSTNVPSISKGLYYDCVNLLIAPELGPYERLKVLEWRSKNFSIDGSPITDTTDPNYGKGSIPLSSPDPNSAIEHNAGVLIQKDYQGLNINGQTAAFVYGDDTQVGWGSPENTVGGNTPCNNSLEAYYAFLGMNNKVNPGGASGSVVGTNNTWNSRANYLAYTLSNEELECYYQKFVTRSFTIKYKLNDTGGNHQAYNNMRISQLRADQVSAYEIKDDLSLPKKDIYDPDNHLRFEYENYKFFWDISTASTPREVVQNNVDQMMIAKPLLLNSMFTENFMAQGSILIPRRFDGRPMDPNIPAQNIICIRKDNMILVDKIKGELIKSPTQKDIAMAGSYGIMRFSLDIGLPMQGGGLIRCKIPLEAAGEDSFAFFLDPEYNRDYLIFKVRDWKGNEKETGGMYEKIKKQNIIQNLHDALQRSQVAQLNERLLEPYISAIATKYQPPPNTAYQMPVLLPSKPGGANIKIDGIVQQKTFFQPLNLILNPIAGGENHFEIKPINDSYYIRTSADNFNWTNYMQQARLSVPRAIVTLTSVWDYSASLLVPEDGPYKHYTGLPITDFYTSQAHPLGHSLSSGSMLKADFNTFSPYRGDTTWNCLAQGHRWPALRPGDLVKQEYTGAIGQVTKGYAPRKLFAVKQWPSWTFEIFGTSEYYRSGKSGNQFILEPSGEVTNNAWTDTTSKEYSIRLYDGYPDGWHGARFELFVNDVSIFIMNELPAWGGGGGKWAAWPEDGPFKFTVFPGDIIHTIATPGGQSLFSSECSFSMYDEAGNQVYTAPFPDTQSGNEFHENMNMPPFEVQGIGGRNSEINFTGNNGTWTDTLFTPNKYIQNNFKYWPQIALNMQIKNGDRVFYMKGNKKIHFANIFFRWEKNPDNPAGSSSPYNMSEYGHPITSLIYFEIIPGIENSAWGNLFFPIRNSGGIRWGECNTYVEITIREGVGFDNNGDDIAQHFTQKTHMLRIHSQSHWPYDSDGGRSIDVRQMNDIPFSNQIVDPIIYTNPSASDYTFLVQNVPIIAGNTRGGDTGGDENGATFICPPCITNDPKVFFETDASKRAQDICGRYMHVDSNSVVTRNYGHPEQLTNISSYHPQFGTMNGGNSTMDLSAVIHDVRQSQLTGWRHDGKNNLWNTHPQRSTIYSLDLLALLNMTYDGYKWTHRLAPNPNKRVEYWHVTSSPITTSLQNMEISNGNTRDKINTPILIISDIGKGWVDYEGTMMSRERYFRLCEVLGDPPDHYAIAMDDLGNTSNFHGDLDIPGINKGFYGKYFLEGAAPWDLSANMASPDGSAQGGNFIDHPNKVQLLNNPIQHLHYGGYTTLDDPTTGAGCVGFPNADRLKERSSKWNGGNHRKQFRLAFETTGERTLPKTEEGKLNIDGYQSAYLFFPHWSNSNPVGQQDAYHSVATDFLPDNNYGTLPLDAMRMVHPSKYVFDPDLAGEMSSALQEQATEIYKGPWSFMESITNTVGDSDNPNTLINITRPVIDASKYGVWTGGAKDRNIDGNIQTYVSNYYSEPFTMEYISYRYQPIIHGKYHNNDWRNWYTSYSSNLRTDKDNKFLDISPSDKYYKAGSIPISNAKTHLLNDASLVWEDIHGISNQSQGDGYVDNSRYRWAGSTFYTHNGKVKPLFGKWRAAWIGTQAEELAGKILHYQENDLTSGGGFLEEGKLPPPQLSFSAQNFLPANIWYNDLNIRQIGNTAIHSGTESTKAYQSLLSSIANSGSTSSYPSGINVAVPSLKNDCVGKEVSFKLHTSEKIGQSNWKTKTTDVPYRAWMTQENQQRYYDTIKFFSTRADITGDTTLNKKPERDEKRQARSETEVFLDDKTDIEGLI